MSATQDVRAPGPASASSATTATARVDATLLKHVLVAIGLSIALTTAVSVVDYIPTQDGPLTVLNAYLELHLRDPGKGYADFLVPNLALTSRAFDAVFTPMLQLMPWRDALRVTLSAGALLWAWGVFALLAVVQPRRLVLSGLGFATALSWPFYMGFFSYWISAGLFLLVLALALACEAWNLRALLWLGAGLLAVTVGHSFVGCLLGLCLVVLAWVRTRGRERMRALFALMLAALPSLGVTAWSSLVGGSAFQGASAPGSGLTWLSVSDALSMQAECFAAGPLWRSALPPLVAVIGLGSFLLRDRRVHASANERALALCALILLAGCFAMPFHTGAWSFVSPRCVPAWTVLGIALVPVERLTRPALRVLMLSSAVGFALAALAWSASYHVTMARDQADALSLVSTPLKRSGARFPLTLTTSHSDIAYNDPGLSTPLLYLIEQGGVAPTLFATIAGVHPLLYRAPREQLFPDFPGLYYGAQFRAAGTAPRFPPKPVQLGWLALLGSAYEDVLMVSEVADADAMIVRGYAVDARSGRAAILHYRGCGLRVNVTTESATQVPLLIDYGFSPVLRAAGQRVVAPGFAGGEAASFPAAPCGPTWVRVLWDNDRSGARSDGDDACVEANAMQLLTSETTAEDRVVTCTAPRSRREPAPER